MGVVNWGSADFSGFEKLREEIEKIAKPQELEKLNTSMVKELAARHLRELILLTPVGETTYRDILDDDENVVTYKSGKRKGQIKEEVAHTGGTLRRGWTAKTQEEAENKESDIQGFLSTITVTKEGNIYKITLLNPIEYASYVNNGHRQTSGRYVPALGKRLKDSWVDGKFFVEIAEEELKGNADKIVGRKMQQYLRRCFQ